MFKVQFKLLPMYINKRKWGRYIYSITFTKYLIKIWALLNILMFVFTPYNVFFAITKDILMQHRTGFMAQGHHKWLKPICTQCIYGQIAYIYTCTSLQCKTAHSCSSSEIVLTSQIVFSVFPNIVQPRQQPCCTSYKLSIFRASLCCRVNYSC